MKSMRFFVSAAALLASLPAFCCGPFWYPPEEYYMFRAFDKERTAGVSNKEENCAAWKAVCSPDVRESDIAAVVYGYSLPDMKRLLDKPGSANTFERYISSKKDVEIADFLVLAKTCELARAEMNDPWYYPAKNDPVRATLEDVAAKSMSYKGTRLEDRYVLQAVRAMFSLGRFSQIDSLWSSRSRHLDKGGVINRMTLGYVAGAAYHNGDEEGALKYYKQAGDIWSMYELFSKYGAYGNLLDFVAQSWPDNNSVPELLQKIVGGYEIRTYESWEKPDKAEMEGFLNICLKGAAKAKDPGIWYYSASFLADLTGNPVRASELLAKAETANRSSYLEGSIKVMRIYLDAKNSNFDDDYKAKLFGQLQWLDTKIKDNITDNVKVITSNGWAMHINNSYYYWNDMLRKITFGFIAPKMDAVDPVLSLRLRNMADNRLLQIVDRYSTNWYDDTWNEKPKVFTMAQYRAETGIENVFDYSNLFFDAMDAAAIDDLIRYEKSMGAGKTKLDRFLDERGYIDHDYVRELIGTKYLRNRQYSEAVKVLSSVSPSYQGRTNVKWYFYRLPFEFGTDRQRGKKIQENYKLSFANEMVNLENRMKSQDPDVRGAALVKYGLGLNSSFDFCWALTHYHLNEGEEWTESEYRMRARRDADQFIETGLRTIRDPELAARHYVSLCRWRSAVQMFPGTKAAREACAGCDQLRDYKLHQ